MLKLRELRKQRSLSQVALSKRAGLCPYTISRLENGHHRPTFLTVRKLAEGLGMKPEDIATSQETAGR